MLFNKPQRKGVKSQQETHQIIVWQHQKIIQIHHQQNQKTDQKDQQEMIHGKKTSVVADGYSSFLHGISLKRFIATGQELSDSRGWDW